MSAASFMVTLRGIDNEPLRRARVLLSMPMPSHR